MTTPITRILPWSELRRLVPFSRQHIFRLEKEGKFPRRIQVGANRIGWLQNEIEAWLQTRIDARGAGELRGDPR